ncbi:uncharacterized protein LOC121181001 isoform X2 [Toxotes jaculatrix]|uniref:uncharacterized protein LOC121181001 isoform X2 n=1 Tax=Toxotes jaculatrix TaxID=941984 RepID=UPI001B3A884E|nr:uncharacterized protein LOC121181001 isoform X2 [Toxotes jaculatrix]
MTTHTEFSHTQSTTGHKHTCSNRSSTQSLDSGIYVHMRIDFDDSLPSTELEDTNDREENESDDPESHLVLGAAGRFKGSTSAVIPEVDNTKALTAVPPPLPPKRYQRSPATEKMKVIDQGPELKAFNKENETLNSLDYQTSPLLGGVEGNNEYSDLVTGDIPDIHNNCTFGLLPKVQPKCPIEPPQRPPLKPPRKPPRLNKPKWTETEEEKQRRQQEAEWRKHEERTGDTRKQEQDLADRNDKMEENEEISGMGSHQHVGKPQRQILVLFTDSEKGGEEGEDSGTEDEDPSNNLLTAPTMTEDSSQLTPDEKPDVAATTGNCASALSPEPTIPPQPPPKPHQKRPPIPQYGKAEDAQEISETLPDGELKQTNQRPKAKGKVKKLAKKVMDKLKEGREEKRRSKAGEMEIEGVPEDDIEGTQDDRRHGEEGWMTAEDEEEREGMDEDAVDQSAVTETHHLMESRIRRRNGTSKSPFSSFKVCSPVKLVEELLSGEEWSPYLTSKPEPPSEATAQPSVNLQFNTSAELDLTLDVFEGSPAVTEEEPVYEDIDLRKVIIEEQQERSRAPSTAIPKILLESDNNQMSLRTKDIYDTVEFIQPVQPPDTFDPFPDVKCQAVLDCSVQKYLIKLSKKRKHRSAWKQNRNRSHENLTLFPSSTASQVFPTSIFYNIPAAGAEGENKLSTVKSGGSSPRSLPKIKMPLKDKTMQRAAQPKEGRGK